MYLNLKQDVETGIQVAVRRGLGWILGGVLFVEAALLLGRRWFVGPSEAVSLGPVQGNTEMLGEALFTRYLFPFELIAMVLLAAMVGVIVIGKGLKPGRPEDAS
jgi:NADH:ubiquinone oxidoreductase subunit 6 (subunit J)